MVANNKVEERILAFFTANASPELIAAADAKGRKLSQCVTYVRELARKRAVDGVAVVDDKTVFAWSMHWLQDGEAEKADEAADADDAPKPKKTKKADEAAKKPATYQPDMMDLLFGEA